MIYEKNKMNLEKVFCDIYLFIKSAGFGLYNVLTIRPVQCSFRKIWNEHG